MAAKDSVAAERSLLFLAGAQHKTEVQKHMAELQEQESELSLQRTVRNSLIVGFVIVMFFTVVALRQKRRIASAKKRSDELLLNILPAETAEELKRKGSADARGYDLVTVMFTDFKDFTQASERMEAKDLVKEIHHCYSEFDKIVDRYNIEKIKTIGDSYMCAGGLPVANKTNAEDVLMAAVEIQQFMLKERQIREAVARPFFQIRIGIHTGSVVAGIVGIRKFAYDIWGDTVNIASRMQSSGEADRINISGSTYELVKDNFNCTYRGKVLAKNKGEIDMYFVEVPSAL
jgi:class 3 adenylate cyclase